MITFPQAVFVIDFCQFRSLFQRTFHVIINPRRLTIITFDFFYLEYNFGKYLVMFRKGV